MKNNLGIAGLVILFMGIMVVLAMLPSIAEKQDILTDQQLVVNESLNIDSAKIAGGSINETIQFNVTNEPTGWHITNCPLTSVIVANESYATLTDNTDYYLSEEYGNITFLNTYAVNNSNTTYISYTYCAEGYGTTSGTRAVAGLILITSALGLLGFVVWGAYKKLSGSF